MSAIHAERLTKRYGSVAAVSDVTFEVSAGEVAGFLGPNGAGKTTTLRMLAGLVRPTSGHCRVLGRSVPGPGLREVGTMIEEPTFYPYLTGRANLRHAALLHGDVPERRIAEALAFVRMENAADKKVRAYSQGMRQRLALARAILWKPKVLLLDEPTNGLDPAGIAEVREALATVADEGAAVLVSSHILAEVEKLADRVLAIDKGVLRFDGSLDRLVSRMDEATVTYVVRAADVNSVLAAAQELGLSARAGDDGAALVDVPRAEAGELLHRLALQGVMVVSATPLTDSLESAYLRLVNPEEKPS
ncbi:MAG: ATP-binding cassette domain-containing protein [Trueperaceae bacterium]